jgi:hypothetical protein
MAQRPDGGQLMALVTAGELSAMRTHFAAVLADTCEIDYVTETQDARGGVVKGWTARGTAIACRFAPVTGRDFDFFTGDKVDEGQYWTLTVASTQTVAVTDRVIFGGATYQVRQVNNAETDALLRRALLVTQA